METRTEIAIPTNHVAFDYLKQLEADGWHFFGSPWGSSESDRTVVAEKFYAPLNGTFKLWFVDRDFYNWDKTSFTVDVNQSGWFITVSANGAKSERSFDIPSLEQAFNIDDYVYNIGICDFSKKFYGFENLIHVGYAGRVAAEFLPEAQAKWQFPGWDK